MALLVWLISFPNNGGLITAFRQMSVETVRRRVQSAIGVPFDVKITRIIGNITDLAVGFNPVDSFAMFRPKGIWVSD